MKRRLNRGFTIIELSVALTIAGILLALGAPSLSGYLQNARLGTLAKSVYLGMQMARSEAVKRNQDVEFVLTSSSLETATANSVVLDTTGRNWVVRARPPAGGNYELVEQKSSNSNDLGGVVVTATVAKLVFNSLGSTAGATVALSNPAIGLCLPNGPARCWNVVVAPGGQVRMCTPGVAADDSRAC